jgi:hypothetical protein
MKFLVFGNIRRSPILVGGNNRLAKRRELLSAIEERTYKNLEYVWHSNERSQQFRRFSEFEILYKALRKIEM